MSEQFVEQKPRKRKRRWVKRAFVLLVVLVVGFVGWWQAGKYSARSEWEKTCETLKGHGHPYTLAQLDEYRAEVPDELNGAKVIDGLRDELEDVASTGRVMFFEVEEEKTKGRRMLEYAYWGIDPEMLSQSKAFLEQYTDILAELARLEDKPTGRRSKSYTQFADDPLNMMLPGVSAFRMSVKLLALQALLEQCDGKVDQAFESTRLMFHANGALNNELSLVEFLVQLANYAFGTQVQENLLCATELNANQLAELQQILHAAQETFSPLNGLRGEMVANLQVCEGMINGTTRYGDFGPASGEGFVPEIVRESLLSEETIRKSQVIIAGKFLPVLNAAAEKKWNLMREKAADMAEFKNKPVRFPLSEYAIPKIMLDIQYGRAMELFLRVRGALLCAKTAMAVERYRLDHGRFPDSLDELVSRYMETVPVDPFDGKPLRYIRTDEGVVIYFVSENGVDDGGVIDGVWNEKKNRYDQPLDDGFRLLNPENRRVRIVDTLGEQKDE